MVNWFGAVSQTGLSHAVIMLVYQPQLLFLKKKKKAEGKPKNDLLRGEPVSPLQVTSTHPHPLYLENVLFS